jgi:hypothetical protein
VDLDARLIEHWQPHDKRPALVTETLVWHPARAKNPFVLDMPGLFDAVFGPDVSAMG